MGLEIKQSLKLSQQLVMTPQLQQAIKLLQLSRLELAETVSQELLENPLLEISEESREEQVRADNEAAGEQMEDLTPSTAESSMEMEGQPSETGGEGSETSGADEPAGLEEMRVEEQVKEDFDWENYLGEYSSVPAGEEAVIHEDREAPPYENMITKSPSLAEHLLWQLRMSSLKDEEVDLGQMIIGSLDADGYLRLSNQELEEMSGLPAADVERVIQVIQQMDPLGVAARDLRECLLLQARELHPSDKLLLTIISDHLPDMERKNFKAVAKKLGVDLEDVADVLDLIRRLDPKPGRGISEEEPQYITPDIYVHKMDGEYVILLNEDGLPKLKVNSFYKDALGSGGDPKAKEYVQTKLRSALWLIRSIHQRQRTIYKVAESIVKFQRDFFDRGIRYLKPLVLRDVAEDVGMHESTISRVTTSKYMHSPQGVFELKFFFNSGINRVQGGAVASESVKERIRQIITAEDPTKPLSDQTIVEMLQRENIDIARRTVAKYRELLGILPSSRRRQPLVGLTRKNQ